MRTKEIRLDPEFIGQMIDCVDDFLADQGVCLPRSEEEKQTDGIGPGDVDEEENQPVIYGRDYDDLADRFAGMLRRWTKGTAVLPYIDADGNPLSASDAGPARTVIPFEELFPDKADMQAVTLAFLQSCSCSERDNQIQGRLYHKGMLSRQDLIRIRQVLIQNDALDGTNPNQQFEKRIADVLPDIGKEKAESRKENSHE